MSFSTKKITAYCGGIALIMLTACSGQSGTDTLPNNGASNRTGQTISFSTSSKTGSTQLLDSLAVLYPNGQLPANRIAQASQDLSQNPAALKLTAATSQSAVNPANTAVTVQAVAADYQPVKRVQNTTLYGAYFFSIYPTEITTALATNPNWSLEGPAFWASLATGTDLYPVHRFRNKTNGSYLYSIYETERADIATNYAATFEYEGVAWYARQTPATGWSALYRFRNKTNGTYLFSAYESEKNVIVATYPDVFALEGIAYYVRQDAQPDPVVPPVVPSFVYKLPDTGITSSQCYGVGSNLLFSCTSLTATSLNTKQDGMVGLDVTAPSATDGKLGFSYSEVPKTGSGNFALTECVKDNLTGLVWEGKPTTGVRAATNTYRNYDSNYGAAAEIAGPYNAATYIAAVNSASLCDFTDWRLPTLDELQSIVDYGVSYSGPTIDQTWFPNTRNFYYWSSSSKTGAAINAWYVNFYQGNALGIARDNYYAVRLVRGAPIAKQYTFSADGTEVTDTKTGLIWQRCSRGMIWNAVSNTCTGAFSVITHEAALTLAKTVSSSTGVAWRLPNIKELSSIADKTKQSPAIDWTAFPATPSGYYFYSSSPYVGDATGVWANISDDGRIDYVGRTYGLVRLVR